MKLEEYEQIMRTGTPSARKMTPDEAKLWAEVSRVNTRLKQEMVAASFTVRALPGDLQEDAINTLQDRERDAGRSEPPDGGDG